VTAQTEDTLQRPRRRRLVPIALAALAGALAGIVGVYGIVGVGRNADAAVCHGAVDIAKRITPLSRGEVAALTPAATPLHLPDLSFVDASGRDRTLADWRGRTVLLNLWATWCVPCRREMPALDALEAKLGSEQFEVVAVNIDPRDATKARTWLDDAGVKRLGYYADRDGKTLKSLKLAGRAFGMPTTLLIDPAGCEIGTMAGPAAWASEDGVRLIEAALEPARS
jgi:thiol-disulfide isomerase/thioredoxin